MAGEGDSISGLVAKFAEVGLEGVYWAGIFGHKLGIHEPVSLKFLEVKDLEKLESSVRHGWELKALKSLLNINEDEEEEDEPIESKLEKGGLDSSYWAPILKKGVNLAVSYGSKFLKSADLEKLKNSVRYDWELRALKQFVDPSDDEPETTPDDSKSETTPDETISETTPPPKKEGILEKWKLVKNLVEELKSRSQSGEDKVDEEVKEKDEEVRRTLDIPRDQWIKQGDSTSLQSIISRYDGYLSDMNTLMLSNKRRLASVEIFAHASGGLALRGVLVGKTCQSKRIVLRTPEYVKMRNPELTQFDRIEETTSKEQSDNFLQTLDTMGYSVASRVKGGYGGFIGEVSAGFKHEEEEKIEPESHEQCTFLSQIKYSVVPTAACELTRNELKLSAEVLQELTQLERSVNASNDMESVYKACEEFFSIYGSHVNAGLLHFGGVSKCVATYSSEAASKTSTVRSVVSNAVNSSVDIGFMEVAGAGVSASVDKSTGSVSNQHDKAVQSKVKLSTSRTGGPQEVTSFHLWKWGLLEHNSTWALIDRGRSLATDFVGIWDLLPNSGELRDPNTLARTLRNAWKNLSGQIETGVFKIEELENKVQTWLTDPELSSNCKGYLKSIRKTFTNVAQDADALRCWVNKFRKGSPLNDFLVQLAVVGTELPKEDLPMMRHWVRKLVKPIGYAEFRGRYEVLKWAQVSVDSKLATAGDLFCTQLKDVLESTVASTIPHKVFDEVIADFSQSKRKLILKIMEDLAMKKDFHSYLSYIQNAHAFALKWIANYTKGRMFSTQSTELPSRYSELTKAHVQKIMKCVVKSVDYATKVHQLSTNTAMDEHARRELWVRAFCKRVQEEVAVSPESLKEFVNLSIVDFVQLEETILTKLETIEQTLINNFGEHDARTIQWEGTIYEQILDTLWGCPSQCPFCGEPCSLALPAHYMHAGQAHHCLEHRPTGLTGNTWKGKELSYDTCGYLVQSNAQYYSRTGEKLYPYRNYREHFPKWDITSEPVKRTSKYWAWFMTKYMHELAVHYKVKKPSIPTKWRSITEKEAFEALKSV